MKTLEHEWDEFAEACGLDGPAVGDVQRTEMRRAFFAGAYVVAQLTRRHGTGFMLTLEAEAEKACLELISIEGMRSVIVSISDAARRSKGD